MPDTGRMELSINRPNGSESESMASSLANALWVATKFLSAEGQRAGLI
jgi:hypothetical protein